MSRTFYITTAIDYTNAPPHIGHAYEKVLADVIARYHRMKGDDVYFLTGVDQHGQKVQQAAQREGIEPRQFADRIAEKFKQLWKKLEVKPDCWASTTDERHKRVVSSILQLLHDRGELYKATHTGFYSVRQEQFLTDKERGEDGEFGAEWGEVVEISEKNWYFKLSRYRDWLINFVRENDGFVIPKFRHTELLNAVERLSGDLCISRPKSRLAWGIELPFDEEFVTYVWFDALINYISFAGYLAPEGSEFPDFQSLWPCRAHVIGKDIMVPAHGVYWPIMLKALGFSDKEIPPLLVHGWWNISGAKMSKSAGNVVDPNVLADVYGADAVRYYLMRDIATGQDSDFVPERLRQRYNADLANDLGNLLNRTLNMIKRYRSGVLRRVDSEDAATSALKALVSNNIRTYQVKFDVFEIHTGLEAVWELISHCNGYVEASAPWKLAKEKSTVDQLDTVLYNLSETLRIVGILLFPVMPSTSGKIFDQLNMPHRATLERAVWGGLPDGHVLGAPTPLFPRLEIVDSPA
jgi:methionyl-tRNA synthetase